VRGRFVEGDVLKNLTRDDVGGDKYADLYHGS
jgi:hypothetical protein